MAIGRGKSAVVFLDWFIGKCGDLGIWWMLFFKKKYVYRSLAIAGHIFYSN